MRSQFHSIDQQYACRTILHLGLLTTLGLVPLASDLPLSLSEVEGGLTGFGAADFLAGSVMLARH